MEFENLLLSLDYPKGERFFTFHVGSSEVVLLLASGFITVIGWAMQEAVRVSKENKEFV